MNEGFFSNGSRHPYFEIGEEERAAERIEHDKWTEHVGRTTGTRWITGKSEGLGWIIFRPNGSVDVWWNRNAALAACHATGNRKVKIIGQGAEGMPPELDALFSAVAGCRRYHKSDGTTCPESHLDPAAVNFRRIFEQLSWKMLQAVGNGDFDTLRTIANHLVAFEKLEDGKLSVDDAHWQDVAAAIKGAVKKEGCVPERSRVLAEFNAIVPVNREKKCLRDNLKRMGFAWLPAPGGTPCKLKPNKHE
jgi:hypothetical protein